MSKEGICGFYWKGDIIQNICHKYMIDRIHVKLFMGDFTMEW